MRAMKIILTILLFYKNSVIGNSILKSVFDFYIDKNIQYLKAFYCNEPDAISFLKYIQNEYIFKSIKNTSEPIGNLSFKTAITENNRQGLFFDASCRNIESTVEAISSYDCSNTVVLILSKAIINITEMNSKRNWICYICKLYFIIQGDNEPTIYNACTMQPLSPDTLENENKKIDLAGSMLQGAINVLDMPASQQLEGGITSLMNLDVNSLSSFNLFVINVHGYLKELLNFEWTLQLVDIRIFSNGTETNSYMETMDFLITSIEIGGNALKNGRTLQPIKFVSHCFFFLHPPIYAFPTFYTKPLRLELWIILGAVLIFAAAVFFLICLINIPDCDNNEKSFFGSVLLVLGILTNQGSILVNRAPKRIVQLTLLWFDIIVWCFYSAVILNYLLHPNINMLKNINDLKEEDFTFGMEDILTNNISLLEKIFDLDENTRQILTESGKFELETGLGEIMQNNFAFFTIEPNILRLAQALFRRDEICNLVTINPGKQHRISMILKKSTQLQEHFQRGLLQLKEFGIIDRENRYYNEIHLKCFGASQLVQVGLKSTSFACKLYALGIGLSLIILFFEIVLHETLGTILDYV